MADYVGFGLMALVAAIIFFGVGWFTATRYYKATSAGEIEIAELADGNKVFSLSLNYPPEELETKSVVSFYIVSTSNKS